MAQIPCDINYDEDEASRDRYIFYDPSYILIDGDAGDIMLCDRHPPHDLAAMLENGRLMNNDLCPMVRDVDVFIHGLGAENLNCDDKLTEAGIHFDKDRKTIALDPRWSANGKRHEVSSFRRGPLCLETTLRCLLRNFRRKPRRPVR